MQCAPEAAKILSQYGAEKHQRNSISVLVGLPCTLDSRLFSAGASRILVHALHATRLGRTNFPTRWTFFSVTVWLLWIFCAPKWSQDFVLFRGLHEDFGGSSSWSILNLLSCMFIVATECLSLFASAWLFISLMVHPSTALRLRLFSHGLRARSFLSSLSSNLFLSAFRWNLGLLDSLILWIHYFLKSVRIPVDGLFRNKKFRTENWEIGSRSVVVSITIFHYESLRTCLHRNISCNSENNPRDWAFLTKLSKKTLVDLHKTFPDIPCVSKN